MVGKTYIAAALPDELLPNWRPFSVCGHPYYPAFFFYPSAMVHGTSFIIPFPRTLHVVSYIHQSDAEEHPPNISFLMIMEDSESGLPERYRANTPELFFKALYELPPGTVLYADILVFLEFIEWTPEAERNDVDPVWNGSFPASEPGVYLLEARKVSSVVA